MLRLLLVALLLQGGVGHPAVCPDRGDATQQLASDLNVFKNRADPPPSYTVVDFAEFLMPGDDTGRFDPGVGLETTAYLVNVKVGGIETANCHARLARERDIHIELGARPSVPEGERVIVEITPKWKARLGNPTVASLRPWIGTKVTVSGWPMFDAEHANMSTNTKPDGTHNWRATSWELHPLIKIRAATVSNVE